MPSDAAMAEEDPNNFLRIHKKPLIIDDSVHVFYLVSKKLSESKDFLRAKAQIYNALFMKKANDLSKNWFSRESLNYYIVDNL